MLFGLSKKSGVVQHFFLLFVLCLLYFDVYCSYLNFFLVFVWYSLLSFVYYQIFQIYYYCFDDDSIRLVFRINYQFEACLLKVYFLFRSHFMWIRNLYDLIVITGVITSVLFDLE